MKREHFYHYETTSSKKFTEMVHQEERKFTSDKKMKNQHDLSFMTKLQKLIPRKTYLERKFYPKFAAHNRKVLFPFLMQYNLSTNQQSQQMLKPPDITSVLSNIIIFSSRSHSITCSKAISPKCYLFTKYNPKHINISSISSKTT